MNKGQDLDFFVFTCHLQTEDSVQQLEGQYQAVISALRSKLDSRAAPPILHLDTAYLQKVSLNTPTFPASFSETLVHTGSSSSASSSSQESWSLLTALMNEIVKLRTQDGIVTEDESQSATSSSRDASPGVTWSSSSEDFTFVDAGDRTELTSSALPLPVQSTSVHTVTEDDHTEMTADPRQTAHLTLGLHRKYRSLLRKRQIPVASGKSMCHIRF